jgi:ATP-binding cassette subfamily F protein uup
MSKNIISCEAVSKAYSEKVICQNQSFGIHENEKIGLIGINGSGKSTILKLLFGIEPVDSGNITFRNDIKINYLQQVPDLNPELTVYEQLYFSEHPQFVRLRKYYDLLKKMEKKPSSNQQEELESLLKEMDAADDWKIEVKAKQYLTKLGLGSENKRISQLSGGQKRKLDLARILMDEPDVLLLDEPTNHLDMDSVEWLEEFLIQFPGIVIFVTHDRYFLDSVSNKIMEVEKGVLRFYEGNYSFYLQKKEDELIDLQRKETRRKAQLQKEMKWLERGAKARTSKPKNHVDRVKELLAKSYLTTDQELNISFQTKRLGKTILEMHNIEKKYDEEPLFQKFSHVFQKKERIGVIGANGCGKTTLLKIITGELEQSKGTIKIGNNTKFAYFKQDEMEWDEEKTALAYVQDAAHFIRTKDGVLHSASEMLNIFLFDGKMQYSKIKTLSGGERKRLYLLRSLMFGSNFIILDEPTNDLDIKTLEVLEDYLDAFDGCLLVVSHDRFFLDRTVDYLFIFKENGIRKFPGNYSDYLLVKRFQKEESEQIEKKEYKKNKPVSTKLTFNEKRELEEIEKQMKALENEQNRMNELIQTKAAVLSPQEFTELTKRQTEVSRDLELLEHRWLILEEKKENE